MIAQRKFVYEQIRDELIDMINQEFYKVGEKLPSERQLANRFSSNFHTVRKALKLLCDSDIIEKQPAKGSFVKRIPRYMPKISGSFKLMPESQNGIGVIYQKKTFNQDLIEWLARTAENCGCYLNIREVEEFDARALPLSRQLLLQGCFSLLILPDRKKTTDRQVAEFVKQSVLPPILLDFYLGVEDTCIRQEKEELGFVESAAIFSAEYFCALGYEYIAFFGPDIFAESVDKLFAFSRFMTRRKAMPLIGLVGDDVETLEELVRFWAQFSGRIGVICYDDEYAFKLMNTVHKLNLRIPEDIALIGANDAGICTHANPPLTTIRFPFEYLADITMKYAMSLRAGKPEKIIDNVAAEFIIRESCGGKMRKKDELASVIKAMEAKNLMFHTIVE